MIGYDNMDASVFSLCSGYSHKSIGFGHGIMRVDGGDDFLKYASFYYSSLVLVDKFQKDLGHFVSSSHCSKVRGFDIHLNLRDRICYLNDLMSFLGFSGFPGYYPVNIYRFVEGNYIAFVSHSNFYHPENFSDSFLYDSFREYMMDREGLSLAEFFGRYYVGLP